MKRVYIVISSIILIFGLISCSVCGEKEPPRRATISNAGGYGMRYHITLQVPSVLQSHSSPCTKYEYIDIHIYVDNLENFRDDEVIWKNFDFQDFPFEENGQNTTDIGVSIQSNNVTLKGLGSPYEHLNGTYFLE
jgi:hypothetical protein